jgi:hypothetical protein
MISLDHSLGIDCKSIIMIFFQVAMIALIVRIMFFCLPYKGSSSIG